MPKYIDLTKYRNVSGARGKPVWFVQLWFIVQDTLVRMSPQFMYSWRVFLYRLFGAKIGANVLIRPTVRITYPWKVNISDNVWIGDNAELYSLYPISIGKHSVVSQNAYLCSASHDYMEIDFPLVGNEISISDEAWVAAGAFIGPGVSVGRGAIVGARSVVISDIPEGCIFAGHPAKMIKKRLPCAK